MDYPSDVSVGLSGGKFTDGNPVTSLPPSLDRAVEQNAVFDELLAVIVAAGLTPDEANLTQLRDSITTLIQNGAHSVIISGAAFQASVTDGMPVYWDSGNAWFDEALANGTALDLAVGIANVTDGEVVCFGETPAGLMAGLTPGSRYYLDSVTPGALVTVAPADVVKIGLAKSATVMFVDIDAGAGDASIGKHTYPLPAEAWMPTITTGCAWFARAEVAADRPEIAYVAFDTGVEEIAEVRIAMPKSWDGGVIQCQALWSHPAATLYGVAFGFKAAFLGDGDAHNLAFGAEVIVTDAGGVTDDLYATAFTADITPSGIITDDGILVLRCARKVADAGDTLDVDARLEQVRLTYTTNAGTDD